MSTLLQPRLMDDIAIPPPSREEFESSISTVLRSQRRRNADLFVVHTPAAAMVVKDFSKKSWWTRFLGRMQIAHECRAYEWLGDTAGVPRFYGRIDRHALAVEKAEVTQLTYAANRYSDGARHLENLASVLKEFRSRGFIHLDLRGRRNVMVRPDGEILVLDLAGAIWLKPDGFLFRLLRPLIRANDHNTLFKWKALLTPDRLTDREKASLRRFRRLQRIWFFNRKGSYDEKWPMTFPRAVELRHPDSR
jgi:hypothetical protein